MSFSFRHGGFVVGALAGLLLALPLLASPRVRYTINEGWRYAPGPVERAEAVDFDDAGWERVDLPHTWNAEDAFDKSRAYRRGVGWFRKRLALDPSLRGKRLFLYFEGANQVADVFVNGEALGRHVGGYTAFVFEVTDQVSFDRENVVAVRVDNSHDDDIPPLNADFTFYGGIYRDVWLLATAPVHLDVLDHAAPGLYVGTPTVTPDSALVDNRGVVVNDSDEAVQVRLVHRLLDAEGATYHEMEQDLPVMIPPGGRLPFDATSTYLDAPRLWSPADPYLYRFVTEVYVGDTLADAVSVPLGFRWFSADGDGFYLNGEPLFLAGTNRHQDRPGLGNALPNAAHREDVRIVKETGFNFLRLAHYPQDPAVLQEADRLGLVVWEEVPVVNLITMSEAFADHAETMLVEMIRQHYNHPSVAMWGYMNEIMLREPKPIPEGYYEAVLELTKRLEARTKAEDPTRLTVTAQSFHEVYNGKGVSDVPDILGMNLYFGWYYHDFDAFGTFLDTLHAAHPDRPLLISEYGAGSDERVHTLEPVAFDFSSEHQQAYHRSSFAQMQARAYLAGSGVWNQFDFGSSHRQDTKNSINQKGIFFFDRTPKDIAFYYEAKLRDTPVLHVAREWDRRAGSSVADRTQPVWVYSNWREVELFRNGESLGKQTPDNATATWQVPFQNGDNLIEARAGDGQRDAVMIHFADRINFFDFPNAREAVFAVNAGAHYQVIGGGTTVWEADRAYAEGGPWGHVGGEPKRTHHRIYGTDDDPLFQATQEGVEAYRFDVPPGRYEVELAFTEIQHDEAGQRVFDVEVNGAPVFTHLDLAGQHGRYVAVTRTIDVSTEGGLAVTFAPYAGIPTISGILIRRLP